MILSPSLINQYKSCPREFLYKNVLGINVEEINWDAANYGSAIHDILEKSDRHELIEALTNAIEDLYLHPERREKMSKLGKEYEALYKKSISYKHILAIILYQLFQSDYQ